LVLALAPAPAEQQAWEFSTICDRHLVLRLLDELVRFLIFRAPDSLPAQT
jgi:hypothetical protein